MIKYFVPIILTLILISCSSQKELQNEKKKSSTVEYIKPEDREKFALNHFINGSIAEAKGDYSEAITEYQTSLDLDTNAAVYYTLAKCYFLTEKIPQALSNSKKSITLNNDKIEYYELLGDIFNSAKQNDSAAAVYEQLVKMDSSNYSAYYKLARIYEISKPLKAIELYNKLTEFIGPDWSILMRVGELYEKLGDNDAAANSINKLLTIDPSNSALQKLLIEIYERGKKYDKALEIVNDIIESSPDDLDALETKAQLYIVQNKWGDASKEYDILLKHPELPFEGKLRIGISYFAKSLTDSSLFPITKKFFNTLDKDTTALQIKIYLGALDFLLKEDSEADKSLISAVELKGRDPQNWMQAGGLLFDNKKYREAGKLMKYAVSIYPEDFAVNLIAGLSFAQIENPNDAKPYLKKAIELSPNDVNALSAYGFTLNQLKDYDNAVKYLNKALTLKPGDVNLLGTLGLIFNTQEKWVECDSVYEIALKIDSTNALVNNNYAYALSERGVQLERALRMVNLALKADSGNSSYLDTKGWVYFKLKEYDKAKVYVQKAISAGGESSTTIEHLGDIVFMTGEKKSAIHLWQKAYNLDLSNNKLKTKIEKGEI
jgi:tetratricopeptide (TPR) repeat protein